MWDMGISTSREIANAKRFKQICKSGGNYSVINYPRRESSLQYNNITQSLRLIFLKVCVTFTRILGTQFLEFICITFFGKCYVLNKSHYFSRRVYF